MSGSDIDCPVCGREHEIHSDWYLEGGPRFEFECECGATFDVEVEFSPVFYIDGTTVKPKKEAAE